MRFSVSARVHHVSVTRIGEEPRCPLPPIHDISRLGLVSTHSCHSVFGQDIQAGLDTGTRLTGELPRWP